ncbi:uncharacterized protein [Oscarella lobularis]|uniref:uncharacterized protein n=1 Tax=Oscarella lobularis TaxID=121494 RepID=UPI0033142AE5
MAVRESETLSAPLEERLARWESEEVKFCARKSDFRRLCRSGTASLWEFIIENVRAERKTSEARANIELIDLRDGWLNESTGSLVGDSHEESDVLSQVRHVEAEIRQLEKELDDAVFDYESMKRDWKGVKVRRTLLLGHAEQCGHNSGVLREFSKRIHSKTENIRKSSLKEMTYFSKDTGLESACTKNLRGLIDSIAEFLLCLEQRQQLDIPQTMKQALDASKDRIWADVEEFLSLNSIDNILASLCEVTEQSCDNVNGKRKAIDILGDIESLRFALERPGELVDVSMTESPLQSVQNLLEELQAQHIRQFLITEAACDRTSATSKELEQLKGQINTWSDENARMLVLCNAEIAGLEAANTATRELEAELLREREEKLETAAQLQATQKTIQNFSAMTREKQDLIQTLVKQNASASSRQDIQKAELVEYVDKTVAPHGQKIGTLASSMKDCVSREVNAFLLLPAERLRLSSSTSSLSRVPVCDFSLHWPLKPRLGEDVLKGLMRWTGVRRTDAPENLLLKLEESLRELEEKRIDSTCSCVTEEKNHPNIVRLKRQLRAVSELDSELNERVTPIVQEKWIASTDALSDCLKMQDTVQCWWTQPAMTIDTRLTYDGQTLHQWLDQWKVLTTQLRQLQVPS